MATVVAVLAVVVATSACSLAPGSVGATAGAGTGAGGTAGAGPSSGRLAPRPTAPPRTAAPRSSSTAAAPAPGAVPVDTTPTTRAPVAPLPTTIPRSEVPPMTAPLSGCGAAVRYLRQNAAPGFAVVCPGDALGHQAMTCWNTPGVCPDRKVIVIADPTCDAAIRNEALNSWLVTRELVAPIDAYGHC